VLKYIGPVIDPSKTNGLVMIVCIIYYMESAGRRVTVNGVRGSVRFSSRHCLCTSRNFKFPVLLQNYLAFLE
jgi:hypothetical protein